MGIFDMDDDRLQNTFQEALYRHDGDLSMAEEDPDVQQALCMYVDQHKDSDFDDALIVAEGGSLGYTPKSSGGGASGGSSSTYTPLVSGPKQWNDPNYFDYEVEWRNAKSFTIFSVIIMFIAFVVCALCNEGVVLVFICSLLCIPYPVYEYAKFCDCDEKEKDRIRRLLQAKDYEAILADKRNIAKIEEGINSRKVCLRKIEDGFIIATINGREYYVRVYECTAPEVVSPVLKDKEGRDKEQEEDMIYKVNRIFEDLYEEHGREIYDTFFADAEGRYIHLAAEDHGSDDSDDNDD